MKIKNIACIASILVVSLSGAKAAATLTAWNFDNIAIGAGSSPVPSVGFGSAAVLGFGGGSSPTVGSQSGSSVGGANAWSVGHTGGASRGWGRSGGLRSQRGEVAGRQLC